MGQFEESLQNFTRDFAYGGAIRHLADHGYSADRILKEYKYPLSRDSIQKIIDDHLAEKEKRRQDPGKQDS
ncbi:MAG: hypothetical protein K6E18_02395 [Lachnospiraceae bacterium]|nr:hypothetical protein [Lachnospiraceae bacterium]